MPYYEAEGATTRTLRLVKFITLIIIKNQFFGTIVAFHKDLELRKKRTKYPQCLLKRHRHPLLMLASASLFDFGLKNYSPSQ